MSKSIPIWSHFIENMPEYSWMILPTLKDALQALHRYDDIEKMLLNSDECIAIQSAPKFTSQYSDEEITNLRDKRIV